MNTRLFKILRTSTLGIILFSLCSCASESAQYKEEGTTIPNYSVVEMGEYPTTEVDKVETYKMNHTLKIKAPTKLDKNGWKSLDNAYHSNLYIKEIEYEGFKYRGLYYFNPANSFKSAKANGYKVERIYWFKYEPIKWFTYIDFMGKKCYTALDVIDSKAISEYNLAAFSISYKSCKLRKFLNEEFYNNVFSNEEKSIIKEEEYLVPKGIDMDAIVSETVVEDYISIPSFEDISFSYPGKELRLAKVTDYARALGAKTFKDDGNIYAGYWLRNDVSQLHYVCRNEGYSTMYANYVYGIRPTFVSK